MRKKKAQFTLELSVLIVCLVAALLAMQIYMKRAFEGKLRQTADSIGEQYSFENTNSSMTLVVNTTSTTVTNTTEINGTTNTTVRTDFNETTSQWGYENVAGW